MSCDNKNDTYLASIRKARLTYKEKKDQLQSRLGGYESVGEAEEQPMTIEPSTKEPTEQIVHRSKCQSKESDVDGNHYFPSDGDPNRSTRLYNREHGNWEVD